jgi:hypothetical protein
MEEWKTAAADLESRIPAGIRFYRDRDTAELRLSKRAIGLDGENSCNMQENEAAFEG